MWDTVLIVGVSGTFGLVALGIYLRYVVHLWRLWRHGIRTSGVVVDNTMIDAESGRCWEPVIAYDDQRGHRVTSQPIIRIDEKMRIGQEVPVVYMAHKPRAMYLFTLAHFVRPLLSNWLLLVLGPVFLGAALAVATGFAEPTSD